MVASAFTAVGFFFGPSVGTAIGNTIAAIFEFERFEFRELPTWFVVLALAATAGIVWHWLQ